MDKITVDKYGKSYDAMIYWYITNKCNFTCTQCAGGSEHVENALTDEQVDIKALKNFLDNIGKTVRISFTGGEPFLIKNYVDALEVITQNHYFSVVSNLVLPGVKEMINRIDPDRSTFIVASAHMRELEKRNLLNVFIDNCLMVKENGFTLHISEVAYPFIKDKIDEYRKIFADVGLELDFMAFRGKWKGKNYPDDYTKEEIKLFNFEKDLALSPEIFNRKGKLCMAGYNIAVVMPKGEIQPCFGLENKIGNIYNKINFKNNLIRCPFNFCGCPVTVFEPYLFKKALQETNTPINETDSILLEEIGS